jgi:Mg2+ and Co2+ transporter CorA
MQQVERKECFVSVAMVINGPVSLDYQRLQKIADQMSQSFSDFELLIVRNSVPRPYPADDAILKTVPAIRLLQLSASVAGEVAKAAAIENAIGDYIVLLSDSDPVETIEDMVSLCAKEADIVIGVADQARSFPYRLLRPLAQRLLHSIGYLLPEGATDLFCLSRRTVNAVVQTGHFYNQLNMQILKTGYATAVYSYKQIQQPDSCKTLRDGIYNIIRLLVFNSTKPLRWMTTFGLLGSFLAFAFSMYSLIINIFKKHVVEGWTSIVLFTSLLFMIHFTMMAFFGEYLRRLLDEARDRNSYSIAHENISSVMINADRLNVMQESVQS